MLGVGGLTRSAFRSLFMYLCIYTTEEAAVERALVMFFFFFFPFFHPIRLKPLLMSPEPR